MPAPEVRRAIGVRAKHALRGAGLVLTCGLLWSACGKAPAPLPQKPGPTLGIPQPRSPNTETMPPAASPMGIAANNPDQANSPRGFEAPRARPAEEAAPQPEAKARDYSAELTALLSKTTTSCLAGFKPTRGSTISVQVTAQVMSSGAVSRAEVQGAGLTQPVLVCIRTLAGTLQLRSPIEGAPRSVQAQVTLQTQGSPDALQPKAADDNAEDERDENPRDSKQHQVADDAPEVQQKDEPTREAPEPPEPRDEPPGDTQADQQP